MTPEAVPLGIADIAAEGGVELSDVRDWIELGLLAPDSDDSDVLRRRARLLGLAVRRGIPVPTIAEACKRNPGLLERFERITHQPIGDALTVDEAAREARLDPEFARRLRSAGGLGSEGVYRDDLEAMHAARTALDAGLPPEALLQLARVFADSLGRVADAEIRLFHFYVHERLQVESGGEGELAAKIDTATGALISLMEPAIAYFHRKAWAAALEEDMLAHFAAELAPPGQPLNQLAVAVLFVDLARFTPLTEAMGDVAAAEVVDRFSDMVREEASVGDGRVVKQIGDEFMLVFPGAKPALQFALRLAKRSQEESRFPSLRMGAHFGTALYREADYLGATVNIAARVTALSGPGQLVVTGAFRDALGDVPPAMEDLGPRPLKGLVEQVELHLVVLGVRARKGFDPVCGMHLESSETQISATWQGASYEFCSEACRRRFAEDPDRYGGASTVS